MRVDRPGIIFFIACSSVAACNKPAPHPAAQAATLPAVMPTQQVAVAPAAALTPAPAPIGAAPSFDFNTIPEHIGAMAPFPYVEYPEQVKPAFQATQLVSVDQAFVLLGKNLHPVDGRIAMRTFYNSDAAMSALELRRNYAHALQALGAVKVNTVTPDDPALIAANGDAYAMRAKKLRVPELNMSYDTWLVRQGGARHWVVVMINERTTRLLAIEEQPPAPALHYAGQPGLPVTATGTPAPAPQPFDVAGLPVSSAPLPPFPLLAYPSKVRAGAQTSTSANFDAVGFIVGRQLREVEGRVATMAFAHRDADMGAAALRHHYDAALQGLGAVQVNTVGPDDPALVAASGGVLALRNKKLRIPAPTMSYDSYLVRAPGKNYWVALMFDDSKTGIVVVEEQAMQQSVALVTAGAMRTALADQGHIALYVHFDTDQATIRGDGKPVVDEIATLLRQDAALRLTIEGHTDNSGDAQHNLALSRQRADAVVRALVGAGIDGQRLQAAGRGATAPLADNKDEAGRAKNRRVELVKI